jgi:hypothetical protein
MRARLTAFTLALLTTVAAAGLASAQPSYPCTETNDNLHQSLPPGRELGLAAAALDAGQCRCGRSEQQPVGCGPL